MAREKMVTRTVGTTEVTALALNLNTREASEVTLTVPGLVEIGTKELKKILDSKSTTEISYVTALKCVYVEKLYGMTEEDFLKYAKELPPRTVKE